MLITLCIFTVSVASNTPDISTDIQTLPITNNQHIYTFENNLGYYIDTTATKTILNIMNKPISAFTRVAQGEIQLDTISNAVVWVTFTLRDMARGDITLFLEQRYKVIEDMVFFIVKDNGILDIRRTGTKYNRNTRYLKIPGFYFPITFNTPDVGDEYRIFIKIHTTTKNYFRFYLHQAEVLFDTIFISQLFNGLIFGILFAMVLVNILLALAFRKRLYLYLSLLIISSIGFLIKYLGFDIYIEILQGYQLLLFFIAMTGYFNLCFVRTLFNISKNKDNVFYKFYIFSGLTLLLLGIVSLFNLIPYQGTIYVLSIMTLIVVISIFIFGVIKAFTGKRIDYIIFPISFIGLFITSVIVTLKELEIIHSSISTSTLFVLSFTGQALVLQISAAFNIRRVEKERIILQEKLIVETKKSVEKQTMLKKSYRRFVPKEFISALNKNQISDIKVGDNACQEASILFTDIVNFSAYTNLLNPTDIISFINIYSKYLSAHIMEESGFIDKYMGDGIMALFTSEHTDNILDTIIKIYQSHEKINEEIQSTFSKSLPQIKTRVGLNTGSVVLGIVGTDDRLNATVLSKEVNLAARLEQFNKDIFTSCLISDSTYNHIQHKEKYHIRKLPKAIIKGIEGKQNIYELLDVESLPNIKAKKLEHLDIFDTLRDLLDKEKYNEFKILAETYMSKVPKDKTLKAYYDYHKDLSHFR